jgi:Esterase-like activity of phytase
MRLTKPPALRIAVLLVLAVLLAPGMWWRSVVPDRYATAVRVVALPFDRAEHDGFTVEGLWQVKGRGENAGGYSAMFLYGRHGIRLLSDRGFLLTIPRPGRDAVDPKPYSTRQLYPFGFPLEDLLDIESVTHDPATGQYWVGYEGKHVIFRYDMTGDPEAFVRPEYTRNWSVNGGIEAMVRLADGRFVVLREDGGDLFLYPGDPVEGAEAESGSVAWPADYSPTDMAQLPDGRLVVVLRRVALHVPVFECRLVLLDIADWQPGGVLQPQPLVQLEDLVPRDNWEAVAVEPGTGGAVNLWLASDDNRSAFQRSLLARLRFTPPPFRQ